MLEGLQLISDTGPRPLEGLMLSLSPDDNSPNGPARHLVVLGRFAIAEGETAAREKAFTGYCVDDALLAVAADDAIVLQTCDDPTDPHYKELARMHEEIANLRTADGRAYRLHPLPWPRAIVDDGRRLASSYANYLIVNDGVVMPAYGDAADARAAEVVAAAHPGREVVAVDARPLIWQNGSVHCLTMQLPAGLLAV